MVCFNPTQSVQDPPQAVQVQGQENFEGRLEKSSIGAGSSPMSPEKEKEVEIITEDSPVSVESCENPEEERKE